MSVVSNSSPLVNMARINRLELLHQLYSTLVIPEAVWYEVVIKGQGLAGAKEIETADWIEVHQVANRALVRALEQDLDPGEAEAIALALEINAELLLMDEYIGREVAQHMGLHCTGLVGALVEAKH